MRHLPKYQQVTRKHTPDVVQSKLCGMFLLHPRDSEGDLAAHCMFAVCLHCCIMAERRPQALARSCGFLLLANLTLFLCSGLL